jgi:hypothetical protein
MTARSNQLRVLAFVLPATVAVVCLLAFADPVAHATVPAGNEIIHIPLRWCALKGTMAVTNPGFFGELDTDSVLLRRQERASSQIWVPGARITFRSPFTRAVPTGSANFPVIEDPEPFGPGQMGDIRSPDNQALAAEFNKARLRCADKWDQLATAFGTPLSGPIALNFRQFVDANGNPLGNVLGLGVPPSTTGRNVAFPECEIPPVNIIGVGETFIGVVDLSFVPGPGPPLQDAKVVAHELGHVLTLEHGNGLDDNNNRRYDGFCDSAETLMSPPTIMHEFLNGTTTNVTALQREQSRTIAKLTPGSQIDPPFELVNADTLSDRRVDDGQDVKDASVDMTEVGMTINAKQERVILSHTLFGLVSKDEPTEYVAFLDLDSDQTTGGRPAELGFPTRFKGAELVTRVRVQGAKIEGVHPVQLSEGRPATPTAWRFEGGTFADVTNSGVAATVSAPVGEELPFPIFDVVSAQLPADVVGHVGPRVRLQAITAGKGKDWVDVLPEEKKSSTVPAESVDLYMTPPRFPACTTIPEVVQQPGDVVTIKAAGFDHSGGFDRTGEEVHVMLGGEPIADVELDRAGNMSTDVAIPEQTRGPRPINIRVEDSALTADCVLQVRGGGGGGMPSPTAAATATASPTATVTTLYGTGGPPLVGPVTLLASLTLMASSVGTLVLLLRGGYEKKKRSGR